ncbi:MAG: hypothetical protein ACKVT2_08085 [Saprospiraceae bacterium]
MRLSPHPAQAYHNAPLKGRGIPVLLAVSERYRTFYNAFIFLYCLFRYASAIRTRRDLTGRVTLPQSARCHACCPVTDALPSPGITYDLGSAGRASVCFPSMVGGL